MSHDRKPRRPAASVLLLTLLLTACAAQQQPLPPVVVAPPTVPPLPQEARQPPVPESCSPSCLAKWKQLVERLQLRLTSAESPASPASGPTTR